MEPSEALAPYLPFIAMGGLGIGLLAVAGWIFTTWLRIRNGYPLENSWGKAVYPQKNEVSVECFELLRHEHAPARA